MKLKVYGWQGPVTERRIRWIASCTMSVVTLFVAEFVLGDFSWRAIAAIFVANLGGQITSLIAYAPKEKP